jgi:hypothetical protein
MLLKLFRSAAATAHGGFEVCAWLDDDDQQRHLYPIRQRIKYGSGPRPYSSNSILCSSELWNNAASLASGDILGLIGDDSVIETPGWDERIEEAFAATPDRILMVYPEDMTGRRRPETLFVSREWVEAVGQFTPEGYPGWFADSWIWTLAAMVGRATYLPDVVIRHHQGAVRDQTLLDGRRARAQLGGLRGIEDRFWSNAEQIKRRGQADKLLSVMTPGPPIMPDPEPGWVRAARSEMNPDTLVVVHCYAGDRQVVVDKLPVFQRHRRPVLILSPADSQVVINTPGVECRTGGVRGYFGQGSLDRQRIHLKMLLDTPYQWFFLNDADSMCVSRELPGYLYGSHDTLWANVVREPRPHDGAPYPKIALHPPYFAHRDVIARMVAVGQIKAHPITPYIDWLMMALAVEAGVHYQTFPDGVSFPAWKHNSIPETSAMGHNYVHNNTGQTDGASKMVRAVRNGANMIHSVKHPEVLAAILQAHDRRMKERL